MSEQSISSTEYAFLATSASKGDKESLEQLLRDPIFRRRIKVICRTLFRRYGAPADRDAEDLEQDIYHRITKHISASILPERHSQRGLIASLITYKLTDCGARRSRERFLNLIASFHYHHWTPSLELRWSLHLTGCRSGSKKRLNFVGMVWGSGKSLQSLPSQWGK